MPIISIDVNALGMSGVKPKAIFIDTNDTENEVVVDGYLNHIVAQGIPVSNSDIALVTTRPTPNSSDITTAWYGITFSNGDWNLVAQGGGGGAGVILPTTVNHIAIYADTDGLLYQDASIIYNDGSINAFGDLIAGNDAGGQSGRVIAYPDIVSSGYLALQAVNVLDGNHRSTIKNNPGLLAETNYILPIAGENDPVIAVVDDSGTPAEGNIAVFGPTKGVLLDGGPVPLAGLTTSTVLGTTQAASVNNVYIVGNNSATTITLPATAPEGSIVVVKGKGTAGWILAANTGQVIQLGQTPTSSGGTITSAANFDSIQVTCITENTTWSVDYVLSAGVTIA
jgi:hypothetical protein